MSEFVPDPDPPRWKTRERYNQAMPFPENGEVNIYELAKVSVKQTLECFAMASFVSCHLMYGIMNCIKV